MAEEITGAGSAPGAAGVAPAPSSSSFLGGYAPAHIAAPSPIVAPAAPAPEPTPEPAPKAEEPKVALAEIMRQERESRKAREAEAARAKDWESKYSDLKTEVERMKRDSDFEADPVAYARARGWDKEKQLLMGQTLLYDLTPDKAPADLRYRMFENTQARKEREAHEAREREATEAEAQAAQAQYQNFVTAVDQAAGSFEPGSFPESDGWFGEDHDTYVRSLVATAVNMASVAQRENRVADLSPASIAKTLEAEVARKMKARDERVQKRTKPAGSPPAQQSAAQPVSGMSPTESTKGTYGSGGPAPKPMTDAERVQRAVDAAWKPR